MTRIEAKTDPAPGCAGEARPGWESFPFVELPWDRFRKAGRAIEGVLCVKASRTRRVLRLEWADPAGGAPAAVFAKRYEAKAPLRRLAARLGARRTRREYRLMARLASAGIPAPEPLAWAYFPGGGATPPAHWLLSREWPNQGALPSFLKDHSDWAEPAARCAGRFLAKAHAAGFYHDDCSAEHIPIAAGADLEDFVKPAGWGPFGFIDVDHGRLFGRPVPEGLRRVNLRQIEKSLSGRLLRMGVLDAFQRGYRAEATRAG